MTNLFYSTLIALIGIGFLAGLPLWKKILDNYYMKKAKGE
ncbi:hypothetical protein LCGC14_0464780 [marine sediment metagenome]|uniref:Uncharacterized protein n=1 Tax=marine sediment metagenome TaxID=412755 RepID=A0A0F9V0S9_9ZZZZ